MRLSILILGLEDRPTYDVALLFRKSSRLKNNLGWVEHYHVWKMTLVGLNWFQAIKWGTYAVPLKLALRTSKIRSLFPGDMWLCPKRGYPKIQRCTVYHQFPSTIPSRCCFLSLHGMALFLSMPPFLNNPISYCWLALSDSIAKKTYPMTSPHSIFLQNAWLQAQQATPPLVVFLRPGHVRPHLDSACSDGHG